MKNQIRTVANSNFYTKQKLARKFENLHLTTLPFATKISVRTQNHHKNIARKNLAAIYFRRLFYSAFSALAMNVCFVICASIVTAFEFCYFRLNRRNVGVTARFANLILPKLLLIRRPFGAAFDYFGRPNFHKTTAILHKILTPQNL